MALPPEPIEEVLPASRTVVIAEVAAVEDLGAWPGHGGPIDGAPDRPAQRVRLVVTTVMRGAPAKEIVAVKPAGAYALRPGVNGVFLLDEQATILGRYGPDTYSPDDVARALSGAAP